MTRKFIISYACLLFPGNICQSANLTSQSNMSGSSSSLDDGSCPTLRLAVFDLDYTIWQPEMYQLTGGAPKLTPVDSKQNQKLSAKVLEEARTIKEGYILTSGHSPIRVFPGAALALTEIEQMKTLGHDIQAAVASKTDEPRWAKICLDKLVIDNQRTTTLNSCFEKGRLVDISYGNKKEHLTRLHKKMGIPFESMAFFDNEYGNIRSVSQLGVKCFYTPHGMTYEDWDKAKEEFGVEFDINSS